MGQVAEAPPSTGSTNPVINRPSAQSCDLIYRRITTLPIKVDGRHIRPVPG
jgi:hypothetical protein